MAAKDTKKMEIHTCYTVKIKHQLDAVPNRKTKKLNIFGWESINPAYGGAGSGGINDLYDIVSLNQGL